MQRPQQPESDWDGSEVVAHAANAVVVTSDLTSASLPRVFVPSGLTKLTRRVRALEPRLPRVVVARCAPPPAVSQGVLLPLTEQLPTRARRGGAVCLTYHPGDLR